jgi:kinesin family member 26
VITTQIASFSSTPLPPSSQQSSPKIVAGAFQQPFGVSRGSNIPTPKGSPMRRSSTPHDSPVRKHKKEEEKWIDGPRVSRTKIAEARHLLREINHVKNHETWIDGPNTAVASTTTTATATTQALPTLPHSANQIIGYGFMDSHKKSMIRQWVENQTSQVFPLSQNNSSPIHQQKQLPQQLLLQQQIIASIAEYESIVKIEDDRISINSKTEFLVQNPNSVTVNIPIENNCPESLLRSEHQQPIAQQETQTPVKPNDNQSEKSTAQSSRHDHNSQEEEDEDSGPSEVPPALPLMDPLGSREISHESIHMLCSRHISRESLSYSQQNIVMMDCALQVTEEDIARTMGW